VVWAKIVPFTACVLLAGVLMNLFAVMDRYMIVHFSGMRAAEALDAVGNYHSSRVVPLLLVSIATMLAAMITPHLSHDWEAGRRDLVVARLGLFLKLFGFAIFAAADVVLLAAPLLFQVAFRGKFPGGEALLPWTLVYCMWFSLMLVTQSYLICAEKAWLTSLALGCGLMLNVVLNLELLPRFGLPGAVLSTTAANALSLGLVCLFNHRLGFHLDHGVKLVFVLPALVWLGPSIATFALAAVAAAAFWTNCLLSREEKQQITEGFAQYAERFKVNQLIAGLGR
jgi:O-antigen/teichoic acid export membrane protein